MRIVTKAVVPACIALLLVWASLLHAQNAKPNWSGTWKLNMEKSDFGKEPKPKEVILKMEDKAPAFKYSATVTDMEGKQFNWEWEGAVDGKPYKETGPQVANVTLKKINDSTTQGTRITADGKTTQTYTSTLSKDGKVITEKWTVKGPEGEYKQHIVWEKQ
jgi:hypothetical protein